MSTYKMNDPAHVREQYRDASNLDARADLHARFSANPYGWFRWMFDRLDVAPGARILEVGGGPGGLWRSELNRLSADARVVFTDLSAGMIAEARTALDDDRFSFVVNDAQWLPFRDGAFDVLIANHMLYHVPDLGATLHEFARVLRSGGRLYAGTNGERHMAEIRPLVLGAESVARPEGFDLETGAASLETCFCDVTMERYPDALEVTEIEPLVDYVASMSSLLTGPATLDLVRERVAATIERDGVFRIRKDAGLFTAVRA